LAGFLAGDPASHTPMKPITPILMALLGFAGGCATQQASVPAAPARTEVVFDHPEKFADVRDNISPTDRGRDEILARIRSYLVEHTTPMVPDGFKLTIVFTDIHLAGDFEPWRGAQWDGVRIIKNIYPPYFRFSYTVTDPKGRVVKEGKEDLRDLDFMTTGLQYPTDDALHYEKDVLDDWAHTTLRDIKKA